MSDEMKAEKVFRKSWNVLKTRGGLHKEDHYR
jgi:hypothetical protein